MYAVYSGEENIRKRFAETKRKAQIIADEMGLPLIAVYSNIYEFWFYRNRDIYTFKNLSFAYALQKLIGVFDFSSGCTYEEFTVKPDDWSSIYYDLLLVSFASSEDMTIYSSGADKERIEKVEYVANDPVVQRHLQVCNDETYNCGVCQKCVRTLMELWAFDKLDQFGECFPVDEFNKRKNRELIKVIKNKDTAYNKEIIGMLRPQKKIPLSSWILGNIMYYGYRVPRKTLKKVKPLKRLYDQVRDNSYNRKDDLSYLEMSDGFNTNFEYAKKYNDVVR